MKIIKLFALSLILLTSIMSLKAQATEDSELFKTLKEKDELLFNIGFNKCKISQFESLVSDDFEFYHDLSGISSSKADFIRGLKNGLCKSPDYQSRRELVEGSLAVYPLKNKGLIYGAIQMGEHRFYETEKGKPERAASVARFTHLWKLENGEWKLVRVLSYDHQPLDKK